MPATSIKSSTQQYLDIEDIKKNIVILKNGSCCLILSITAVNFSLLSEQEQDAIIYSYAGLLNSLTFPIQIIVQSKKKNIGSYLLLLKTQERKIKNPLLKTQMEKYREFVQQTVKENEVLDKKFYIVIPFSNLELGVSSSLKSSIKKSNSLPFSKEYIIEKAQAKLLPKRDQINTQLIRIGLKAKQLTTPELIKLFYKYHNPDSANIEFTENIDYSAPIIQASISEEPTTTKQNAQHSHKDTSVNQSHNSNKNPTTIEQKPVQL